MDDMRSKIEKEVAGKMWNAGKQRARRVLDIYGNVDLLRPYFDAEPHQVRSRLLHSLLPRKMTSESISIEGELYGPLMLAFTLVAILLLSMKASGHRVQEGSLMGTAIGVAFLYWIATSLVYYSLAYLFNSSIRLLEMLSLVGYGLFGPCLCLFLSTVLQHSDTGYVFYVTWFVFVGLSALRISSVLASRTRIRQQACTLGIVVVAIHMLYTFYLKLAYSKLYEAASLL